MVYRKGERRLVKEIRPYTEDRPFAVSIRSGSRWFDAWVAQMSTPYALLTKRTKIDGSRLMQLSQGAEPNGQEIESLAAAWFVPSDGLRTSIGEDKAHK